MYDVSRKPPEPQRPLPPGEQRKSRGSLMPVLVVLFGVASVVVLLAVFAGPAGLMMAAVVGALLAIPLLHYITWGWWLSTAIEDEEKSPEEGK